MQLGLGWIFVGAYAVENGRSIDIALLPASSLYLAWQSFCCWTRNPLRQNAAEPV